MIERARRVFPSMVVSLLLSAPALAAPRHSTIDQHSTHVIPAAEHRNPANRGPQRIVRASKPARSLRTSVRAPLRQAATRHGSAHHFGIHQPKLRRTTQRVPRNAGTETDGAHLIRVMAIANPVRAEAGIAGSETWRQTGMASWYGGKRWVGHATSSGDRYDENALTAAHATLPLGSHVRVTVVGTSRSVMVTINDRPGTRNRIIDLSRGAAAQLGMLQSGVARVELSLR
jgi:rare lipoprotein A (peptidoglycan hydrolase)